MQSENVSDLVFIVSVTDSRLLRHRKVILAIEFGMALISTHN